MTVGAEATVSAARRRHAVPSALPDAMVVSGLAAVLAAMTYVDTDLWGHLRFGLDVLARRRLRVVDPYSFTQGVPWINHEWLSEAIFGLAYLALGPAGLVLLKAIVVTAVLVVLWRGLSGHARAGRWALLLIASLAVAQITVTVRPQLWTLLGTTLLLADPDLSAWAIAPLFAVWANLHGGFTVGLGIVAVNAVEQARRTGRLSVLLRIPTALAATLVTPYGPTLWRFLAETVQLHRDVAEWLPVTSNRFELLLWIALVAVAGWQARRARVGWPIVAGLVGLAYASCRVIRLVPFFAVAAVLWPAPPIRRWPRLARAEWAVAVLPLPLILGGTWVTVGPPSCPRVAATWPSPDIQGSSALDGQVGTLLVPFEWGEYAIWRWGPRLRVSVDGRRETVYADATVREQVALAHNDPRAVPALGRLNPEFVWYPATATVARGWLLAHGYHLLSETAQSYVATRLTIRARPPAPAISPCFPGVPIHAPSS